MGSKMLQLANECSAAASFEAAVLELLQDLVGFDVAFFSVKGEAASPTVVGLGAELVARAVQGGSSYERELLPVKQAALRANGVAVDTRVLGEAGVRRTAYHRDLARAVGGRHSLMAYVPLRGRVVAAIMLGRTGSTFTDREMAAVEALLPDLGVARASYGLPLVYEPLSLPSPPGWLRRFGSLRRGVLAVERMGEATVEVRDRNGFREMVARESGTELVWTRAKVRDPSESGWPYVELFHLAAIQAQSRRRALFVGCGGAVALRQFAKMYPGLAMDLVEREPRVIELARAWYDLDRIPGLTVHLGDGATFMAAAAKSRWDVVVIDAFDARDSTEPLRQPQFLSTLRGVLTHGGALAMNVIGTLDGRGPVRDVAECLASLFHRVRIVPVMQAGEEYAPSSLRNVVLVASKSER
jgi:spermidine synthase